MAKSRIVFYQCPFVSKESISMKITKMIQNLIWLRLTERYVKVEQARPRYKDDNNKYLRVFTKIMKFQFDTIYTSKRAKITINPIANDIKSSNVTSQTIFIKEAHLLRFPSV